MAADLPTRLRTADQADRSAAGRISFGSTATTALSLWPLVAGIAILAMLWLGPLPAMSRRAFSPHMILHLGVVAVVAPLIALWLARLGRARLRVPASAAILASIVEMVVVWGWHAPALHEAAALYDAAFAAQQLSFLAAGLGIWATTMLAANAAAPALGVIAMLFTFMHMTMLGVLLTVASDLIYSPAVCLGAFGFDPLQDQRLGGALMAVAGGAPFLIGGVAMAYQLLEPED